MGLEDIVSVGLKLIDKVIPDPQAKADAQIKLIQVQQAGELEEVKTQLSAIIAEAQSTDPWTSRARPSFLYVMYLMILFGIPMGILSIFSPEAAVKLTTGVQAWLSALPEQMWWLFGCGYLGYATNRTFEKIKGPRPWNLKNANSTNTRFS